MPVAAHKGSPDLALQSPQKGANGTDERPRTPENTETSFPVLHAGVLN